MRRDYSPVTVITVSHPNTYKSNRKQQIRLSSTPSYLGPKYDGAEGKKKYIGFEIIVFGQILPHKIGVSDLRSPNSQIQFRYTPNTMPIKDGLRTRFSLSLYVVVVVVSNIQRIGCQPEKTTSHGGQSRSWYAEQGKENKIKSLAAYPPPTPHTARSEKINKITRRIYRRYAGGRSRVRTRIPSARRLGLWVWLRKILHSRLR